MMTFEQHLEAIPSRVQTGMAEAPGISQHMLTNSIDLRCLNLAFCGECIAGQLYDSYACWETQFTVYMDFAVDLGLRSPIFVDAVDELDDDLITEYYNALTIEWCKQITLLRTPTRAKVLANA